MSPKTTGPIAIKVELPDLTKKLLNAVQAVMNAPKEWKPEATVTVDELSTAIAEALLPDWEHNEEICGTGLVACPDCAACS